VTLGQYPEEVGGNLGDGVVTDPLVLVYRNRLLT
jgi:hypothetical protein